MSVRHEPIVEDEPRSLALRAAVDGVSAALASLGRVFLCVDATFCVVHASSLLDRLSGRGTADAVEARFGSKARSWRWRSRRGGPPCP